MRYPGTDTVNSRLAENKRLSQRDRVLALDSISRPAIALLLRLLKNPESPARIIGLAAKKYHYAILLKSLAKLPPLERRIRLKELANDPSRTSIERGEALREMNKTPVPDLDPAIFGKPDRVVPNQPARTNARSC